MYSLLHILMSEAQANWGTTRLASALASWDPMLQLANKTRFVFACQVIES